MPVALVVLLAACTAADVGTEFSRGVRLPAEGSKPPPEQRVVLGGTIAWEPCGDDAAECGAVTVPVDWGDPGGPQLDIAVARLRALSPDRRIGALVYHPGGPGVSGVDMLLEDAAWGGFDFLRRSFDVVAFDARGTGHSSGLDCVPDEVFQSDVVERTAVVDTPEQRAGQFASAEALAAGCLAHAGDLAPHLSTPNVARDLDLVREALGQEQLTYLGLSYGSLIGVVYASLFPENVRALVLDGPAPSGLEPVEVGRQQITGFERALDAFLADCAGNRRCPLNQAGDPAEVLDGLIERLRGERLPASYEIEPGVGRSGTVGGGELSFALVSALYSDFAWPILADALTEASVQGDGGTLLYLADFYLGWDPYEQAYSGLFEQFWAVGCADVAERHATVEEADADLAELLAGLPGGTRFADLVSSPLGICPASFPVSPDPVEPVSAPVADRALVVAVTGDPATPREWADVLAAELGGAPVLWVEGNFHVAVSSGRPCVERAVRAFLERLDRPDPLSC